MKDQQTLGDRLKDQRGETPQKVVAALLGTSQQNYGRWEADEQTTINPESADALMAYLGVSEDELGGLILRSARRRAARRANNP